MPSGVSMSGAVQIRRRTQEELERELAEAREQQAVTAEILQVISGSPMDLQRAFTEIAASAARLCEANDAAIHQVDGDSLPLVAHHGPVHTLDSLPLARGVVAGRAVLDRQTIQVADLQAERDEYPEGSDNARRLGFRTNLTVPLIRAGTAIGVISIRRPEARLFSDKQVALLKTFADQAVIAIENTKLFEAEQASKHELQTSLEYQTAISAVLGIISRSPMDVQPVFDTIARSAAQLCSALNCFVYRFDGRLIHYAASDGLTPESEKIARSHYPLPPGRATAATRAILNSAVEEIPDVEADTDYEHKDGAKLAKFRSTMAVP